LTPLARPLNTHCQALDERSSLSSTCTLRVRAESQSTRSVAFTHRAAASSDVTAKTCTSAATSRLRKRRRLQLLTQCSPLGGLLLVQKHHASLLRLHVPILSMSTTTTRVESQRDQARCTPRLGRLDTSLRSRFMKPVDLRLCTADLLLKPLKAESPTASVFCVAGYETSLRSLCDDVMNAESILITSPIW